MKPKPNCPRLIKTTGILGALLSLCSISLAAPATSQKNSGDSQKVAQHLIALLPQLRTVKNETNRESTLRAAATSLARAGNHDAALKFASSIPQRQWDENIRDEIWRLRTRRLAGLGRPTEATQAAANIKGEYSRADAWLAIARANLRANNMESAKSALQKSEPILRASKSALAVGYLAWLWTRTGDESKARALFEFAATIPNNNSWDEEILGDENRQRIAFYQAKAGWKQDALKTAGDNPRDLVPLRAVFIERREGGVLHNFAARLPAREAVSFLIDLASAQSVRKQTADATQTLKLALNRIEEIPKNEQNSPDGIYLQTVFALLEVSIGQAQQGRARFAALSKLPNFTADHAWTFYFLQIAPSGFVKIAQTSAQQTANENGALAALAKMPVERRYPSHYLEIAEAQQKRGAKSAMRQTLRLAKIAVEKYVTKPLTEEKDRDNLRTVAASQLMQIAQVEKAAGDLAASRSTLAQAMKTSPRESKVRLARNLLDNKWNSEAAALLKTFVTTAKLDSNFYRADIEEVPGLAALHASQSSATAALDWVLKIRTLDDRAAALSKILLVLHPIEVEERELILRGNKLKGAQISSQFSLPGYFVSENFNEFE